MIHYVVLGFVMYMLSALAMGIGYYLIHHGSEWYVYDDAKFLRRDSAVFGVLWFVLTPLAVVAYCIKLDERVSGIKDKDRG